MNRHYLKCQKPILLRLGCYMKKLGKKLDQRAMKSLNFIRKNNWLQGKVKLKSYWKLQILPSILKWEGRVLLRLSMGLPLIFTKGKLSGLLVNPDRSEERRVGKEWGYR